ncbi:EDD domain protein, DegV family [Eubacterium oxidoreducens]|uniref:EDD domain protein, DegV family n=2 Tax=Eubacterium oxidoreducens TaxID=1732 RepID=A0A1G6AG22_EUBOX|nr:DegV family protein [Eubacterium oxidoreducens]SDB07280.1 EDD domain protein, DegV family [Eubacterium oxidoreducens]
MAKVAIVTDSNSGITQDQAKELGISVLPMPFFINGKLFYEDIDLTQEQFYEKLEGGAEISTSQPAIGDVQAVWDELLKEYDEIVHIPMSSGLSSSCETALMIAQDYDEKVQVVNNQRISVTQRRSALDALELAKRGKSAKEIKDYLEKTKFDSSIYIMIDTLEYLKKGGRLTAGAAALGTLLKIKPVLQIQGEKLDSYAKARTIKQAKKQMLQAVMNDLKNRFGSEDGSGCWLDMAYTKDIGPAEEFKEEVLAQLKDEGLVINPLSLSISCHIGPGALALTATKKLPDNV